MVLYLARNFAKALEIFLMEYGGSHQSADCVTSYTQPAAGPAVSLSPRIEPHCSTQYYRRMMKCGKVNSSKGNLQPDYIRSEIRA